MASPSKQKGTGAETEFKLELLDLVPGLVRTPASSNVDLAAPGTGQPIRILATRPDRGQWLATVDLYDLRYLLGQSPIRPVEIEVKRFARFAHHAIWSKKFGPGLRKPGKWGT